MRTREGAGWSEFVPRGGRWSRVVGGTIAQKDKTQNTHDFTVAVKMRAFYQDDYVKFA